MPMFDKTRPSKANTSDERTENSRLRRISPLRRANMASVSGVRPQDHQPPAQAATIAAVNGDNNDEGPSVELAFAGQQPPPWWRQVTARSVATSVVLGAVLSFMSMRIGLTAGVGPSFNIVASLLGFFAVKSWTRLLARCGVASQPFTRQENVVLQTCIISCATLSFYGMAMQQRPWAPVPSANKQTLMEIPGSACAIFSKIDGSSTVRL